MKKYLDTFASGYTGYAEYLWNEVTHPHFYNYFYWLIGISLLFFALQMLSPWRKNQSTFRKDFWLDFFYMFFNFFLFSLIIYNAASNVVVELFNDLLAGVGITNIVAIEINSLPIFAQLLVLFVVRDFIQWNIHRLLHRIPFLWEFHKVHHSVEEMGFAAHLRYHWFENVAYNAIQYVPLALIGFGIDDFFLVYIVSLGIGHFNHSNINVPLGPLKYILNNPQMHIWHHARVMPEHSPYGVNYGISLSAWDYLFKTDHIPESGRDIELGFPGLESFPKTFFGQSLHGLRKKRASSETE